MTQCHRRNARVSEPAASDALLTLSRVALDSAAQGICVYDADNRVVLFNRAYVDSFNLSAEVIRPGLTYRQVMAHSAAQGNFASDRVDSICRERLALLAAGKRFSVHQEMPSGRIMTLDIRPLPDGGWITVAEDITRRARLESALQLQTERIERAVAHMSHGLTMFGADERLVLCNEQYLRVYGLDPNVVKPGITHREVIEHFVSRGNAPGRSAEDVYTRRMTEIRQGEATIGHLIRSDGHTIQSISSPMPDGGWVSACYDVTDRMRQEDALKRQNLLLDAALENMAHGLCVYDKDMRLVCRNSRYLDFYKLSPDEARPGTHLSELVERTSMDDFGIGYSSLSYLRQFPFDKIKIDRSFVGTLGESTGSEAIVRTIASLGANLGMETTAEGIETPEQLELVRQAGCTEAQGFHFSRPCAASDVFRIIERMTRAARVA
jgi:PAS domain-containing protein